MNGRLSTSPIRVGVDPGTCIHTKHLYRIPYTRTNMIYRPGRMSKLLPRVCNAVSHPRRTF